MGEITPVILCTECNCETINKTFPLYSYYGVQLEISRINIIFFTLIILRVFFAQMEHPAGLRTVKWLKTESKKKILKKLIYCNKHSYMFRLDLEPSIGHSNIYI